MTSALIPARWQKSSRSGGGEKGGGNCIEIAHLPHNYTAVRDSKNPTGPTAQFPSSSFTTWIANCKTNYFDLPR